MTCHVKPSAAHIGGVDEFKTVATEYCRSNARGKLSVEWGGTHYQVEKSEEGVAKQASHYRIVRFFAAIIQLFTHRIGDGSWQSRTQRLQHAWCEVRNEARVAEQALIAKARLHRSKPIAIPPSAWSGGSVVYTPPTPPTSPTPALPASEIPSKSSDILSLSDPRLAKVAFYEAKPLLRRKSDKYA
ncbi:hypothetical protein FNU76_02140 [Chitinimonas arctica]|uniref:Uncharacterized protein n=1 Tax=Chitinimonas arctica TaxID=2594795 RepID=A0A516SAQ8_9NEIS|nr:hypothetical protein [Chitinimonas arctica]QDQ25247.1 hypothetical protein FNU76_02140 [Chitinimonas arctica]